MRTRHRHSQYQGDEKLGMHACRLVRIRPVNAESIYQKKRYVRVRTRWRHSQSQADETLEMKIHADSSESLSSAQEEAPKDEAGDIPINLPPSPNEFAPRTVPPSPGHPAYFSADEFFKVQAQ